MTAFALETRYKGHRFRSRLEARWAVFFDHHGIDWLYEPQGYMLSDGKGYLPDFYLPTCGTWVEVKGSDDALDAPRMVLAAAELPLLMARTNESGPRLLILGHPPQPKDGIDMCWTGLTVRDWDIRIPNGDGGYLDAGGTVVYTSSCRFGMWRKNKRPWVEGGGNRISTVPTEWADGESAYEAYKAFHSARFEHGESGYMPSPPKYGYLSILGDLCEHGCTYDTFCPVCDTGQESTP